MPALPASLRRILPDSEEKKAQPSQPKLEGGPGESEVNLTYRAHSSPDEHHADEQVSSAAENGHGVQLANGEQSEEDEDGRPNGEYLEKPLVNETVSKEAHQEEPAALRPKVFIPYKTKPGEVPRRVQIDRLFRKYNSMDVVQLIRQQRECIDDDLVHEGRDILPLEIFDDYEYESRTADEWADPRAIESGVRARAAILKDGWNAPEWLWCRLSSYEGDNNYRVILDSSEEEVVVPRVSLCFATEDPENFAERRVAAMKSRADAKRQLEKCVVVQSMSTEDIPPLSAEQINRIDEHVLGSKTLRERGIDTSAILSEVNLDYTTTMNLIGLYSRLRDVPAEMRDSRIVNMDIKLPAAHTDQAPEHGLVQIPDHNFLEQFSEFSFNTFLTRPEAIHAIVKILEENNKVLRQTGLFAFFFTKSMRLEEFDQLERQQAEQISVYLRDTWTSTLKNAIRSNFRKCGKGWFNLMENRFEIYRHGKLRRFLTMTRFRMEDTLRMLVNESIQSFVQFMRSHCSADLDVQSLSCVNDHDNLQPSSKKRRVPVFALDVQVDEQNGCFVYSHSLERFPRVVQDIFIASIRSVQAIPDLEPMVMKEIKWTAEYKPKLASVSEHEPHVSEVYHELGYLVKCGCDAAAKYLSLLAEFEELVNFNVGAYIRELSGEESGEEAPLNKLMAELEKHSNELEDIKARIPLSICVGPFQVRYIMASMLSK